MRTSLFLCHQYCKPYLSFSLRFALISFVRICNVSSSIVGFAKCEIKKIVENLKKKSPNGFTVACVTEASARTELPQSHRSRP